MFKLTVLDDYQGLVPRLNAIRTLDGLPVDLHVVESRVADEARLIETLRDTDGLILIRERTRITARIIEALPELKLIVQTGRLAGCIDLDACERHGIAVRDGTGNPVAPTELTWALILAASRHLVGYARQLDRGRWQHMAEPGGDERIGRTLSGRTLGIWALGKIGRKVAAIGEAFGMKIAVHGREQSRTTAESLGYTFVPDRRAFLAGIDVLSLHLKLSPETRHMISAEDLAAMRPDALLVNTSRAELLAPNALLGALANGRPCAAAIDVFEDEPEGVRAYVGHPSILCTPHLGFVEQDTYEAYFGEAFEHVRSFIETSVD